MGGSTLIGPLPTNGAKMDESSEYSIRDHLGTLLDRMERLYDTHIHPRVDPWGSVDVGTMLRVRNPKGLVVLASPPSFDADSVAMRIVHHVGVLARSPVLVLSTKPGGTELAERLVALVSGVQTWKIHCGHLADGDWERIGTAISRLADCPVQISGIGWDEPWQVAAKVREFGRSSMIDCMVFDAFASLVADSARYQEDDDVAELLAAVREVAYELKVPVTTMRPNDRWFSRKELAQLDAVLQDANGCSHSLEVDGDDDGCD